MTKNKVKKTLLAGLSLVLVAAISIVGTIAYLTDTDSAVNVMTVGNVSIAQHEYERVIENGSYKTDTIDGVTSYVLKDFTQGKALLPIVGDPSTGAAGWDNTVVRMTQVDSYGYMQVFAGKNAQDKFVTVENTGKTDAYVRTLVAIECGEGDASLIGTSFHNNTWARNSVGTIEVDDNKYYLIECVYNGGQLSDGSWRHGNGILPAGDTSYPSLSQVYLKSVATNEDCEALDGNNNGTLDILVFSQAVQAAGFADAQTALDTAFGDITTTNHPWLDGADIPEIVNDVDGLVAALNDGKDVVLTDDVEATSPISLNGSTLNGGGNTLDSDYAGTSGWGQYAIVANSGTVENINIVDAFRGIGSSNTSDDVYIKNVTIDNVTYAINGNGTGVENVYVSDSTIYGWNSYADIASISFTDCTLGKGNSYDGYMVIYGTTNFTNCVFEDGYSMCGDLRGELGETVTFTNCTYNGTKVTADNFKTLFMEAGDETDFNKLANYKIVIDGATVAW